MKPENTADFYEREAGCYDKRRWSTPAGQIVNTVQLEILKGITRDLIGGEFLEIAAGTGRCTKVLLEKASSLTALDISSSMLGQLKQYLEGHPQYKYLRVIVGDAANTKLDLSSYDVVACFNALSHIPEYRKVLAEAYRVLKPNGVFLLNVPNYLSLYLPFGLYVNLRKKSVTRNVYTRWYTYKKLKKGLEEAGFHVEEVIGQLHFPTWTPSFLLPVLKVIDKSLRNGIRARLAPILFIKARKVR